MPHINILKEMLKNSEVVPLEDHPYGKETKHVALTEREEYSVIVKGLPKENSVIVLKIDNFPAPSKIFKCTKGECKRADFVIVFNGDNKKIIIFIELKSKSSTKSKKHIIAQLKGAQCVMKYIEEVGKLYWNSEFLSNFEYRFVSLVDINVNKRTTRYSSSQKTHNTPEDMLIIKSPGNLYFKQLINNF